MDDTTLELQSKIAFLERTVETLDEVVIEQGREIEGLTKRLALLEGKLRGLVDAADGEEPDPLSERPPHY